MLPTPPPPREWGSSGDKRGMRGRDEAGKPQSRLLLRTLQDGGSEVQGLI